MGGGISSIFSSSGATLKIPFFMLLCGDIFFLVDHNPWEYWTMLPFIVSTARGKYLAAFVYVRPDRFSKCPLFIALSHVDLTRYPDAACMYRNIASTIGRSYALYDNRVICLFYVFWFSSNSLFGLRVKRHSFGISFSLHPIRMGLPPGKNTVTSCLVNMTVHSASHMGPTATRVLVKYGMMYPVVGKSSTNCRIGSVAVNEDLYTCPVDVPK